MKSVIFSAILLLPLVSQAEVKRPGTFVPNLCSHASNARTHTDAVAINSVCVGSIVGMDGKVIELSLNDGGSRRYGVKMEGTPPGGMGSFSNKFNGDRLLRGNDESGAESISGVISTSSGISFSSSISLRTSGNLTFKGPLEIVYVTE